MSRSAKGKIVLRPLNKEYFQKMSGILKGGGPVKGIGGGKGRGL